MSFIVEDKVFWHRIILALFILSLLGPWMYDRINVPAEYPCEKPFIRLEGDFCGYPMSEFLIGFPFTGRFFIILWELITGTFTGQARELFVGLFLLPILPFFTTILLIWKKETRRLQMIDLVAWILALIPTLTVFIFLIKLQTIYLWGLWLYILLAISALIFEISVLKSTSKNAT